MLEEITMKSGETPKAYRIRLYKNKDTYGLSNEQIGALCNKAFGVEYDESAHRKKVKNYLQGYEDAIEEFTQKYIDADCEGMNLNKRQDELAVELEKEKIKLRDERNEYKRLIREQARRESFVDLVKRTMIEHEGIALNSDEDSCEDYKKNYEDVIYKSDNDLIIPLMDIHAGININNFFNKFNYDILKKRLNKYLQKIYEIKLTHCSEDAYIILSEVISGLIHSELRLEANQNIIEQFLSVTDLLSEFIKDIAKHFQYVHVYVCPGNHSRINPNKDDSMKGENMDNLLIPFLSAKLQNFYNIQMHKNIEESTVMFSVRGQKVFAVHGDKDTMDNVVNNIIMIYGIKPDIVYMGHKHTNSLKTIMGCKVIQVGCVSGMDNYCLDKRLKNSPEQIISVVNNDGIECLYDVQLH